MHSKSGSRWDYRYLLLPGIETRLGCRDAPWKLSGAAEWLADSNPKAKTQCGAISGKKSKPEMWLVCWHCQREWMRVETLRWLADPCSEWTEVIGTSDSLKIWWGKGPTQPDTGDSLVEDVHLHVDQ